ncbi:MAG TPA: hypothetical protein VF824_12860 [Thermoanaerobaculia bacterium]|jgi:hypothetical protein
MPLDPRKLSVLHQLYERRSELDPYRRNIVEQLWVRAQAISDHRQQAAGGQMYGPTAAALRHQQLVSAPPLQEAPSVGGFLMNVPKSAYQMGENLVSAVAHPVRTLDALGRAVGGGVQRAADALPLPHGDATLRGLIPASTIVSQKERAESNAQAFDALMDVLKQRYGGVEQISHTLYTDPVGAALDASAVLGGGSGALRTVPKAARAADALEAASRAINPVRSALKATGAIVNNPATRAVSGAVKEYAGTILGGSAGVGAKALRTAATAAEEHPKFEPALRGQISHAEIVDDLFDAIAELKRRRKHAYLEELAQMGDTPIDDLATVRQALVQSLSDLGVDFVRDERGRLVPKFDRGAFAPHASPEDVAKINGVYKDVMGWGRLPRDVTPLGVDELLGRVRDALPRRGTKLDAALMPVANELNAILERNVPNYAKMTEGYHKASRFLRQLTNEFSLKDSETPGAAIRKLQTALNQRNDYRADLLEAVQSATGNDFIGALAGPTWAAGLREASWAPWRLARDSLRGAMPARVWPGQQPQFLPLRPGCSVRCCWPFPKPAEWRGTAPQPQPALTALRSTR